jgi:hypothetical protein
MVPSTFFRVQSDELPPAVARRVLAAHEVVRGELGRPVTVRSLEGEQPHAREDLPEHDPDRVQIGPAVELFAARLLG